MEDTQVDTTPSPMEVALTDLNSAIDTCDRSLASVMDTAMELVKLRAAINGVSPEDLIDTKSTEITTRIPARAVLSYKELELVRKQNELADAITTVWATLADLCTKVRFETPPDPNEQAVAQALSKFSLPTRTPDAE